MDSDSGFVGDELRDRLAAAITRAGMVITPYGAADAILREFDVGLRQTLTPPALPAGMTPEKLREMARLLNDEGVRDEPYQLNSWAADIEDALLFPAFGSPPGMTATRLNERRAVFVYEGARIAAMAALAPIVPEPWEQRDEAFRSQFLDVIEQQCGPDRKSSPAELHDDWVKAYEVMGWRWGSERDVDAKTHPDMVPYDDLGQLEQDKDAVFVALCEIARQWVRS